MNKPPIPERGRDRDDVIRRRKRHQATKRTPKFGRRKRRRRPHSPSDDMLNVACTRCNYHTQMKRGLFGRESRRATRCRCPQCGGNVVLAKYVDVNEKEN